jgi:hypothetical protein
MLIALYDATPEAVHFADPSHTARARELGAALAKAGIGLVTTAGSPLVSAAIGAHEGRGAVAIVLSPAANSHEHAQAYRLGYTATPMIYTGKGALGADKTALASAHGLAIVGSDEELLKGIFDYTKSRVIPIAILTSEAPQAVHERIYSWQPEAAEYLVVSGDPAALAHELGLMLRRHSLLGL